MSSGQPIGQLNYISHKTPHCRLACSWPAAVGVGARRSKLIEHSKLGRLRAPPHNPRKAAKRPQNNIPVFLATIDLLFFFLRRCAFLC
jgi:hypothetical protein